MSLRYVILGRSRKNIGAMCARPWVSTEPDGLGLPVRPQGAGGTRGTRGGPPGDGNRRFPSVSGPWAGTRIPMKHDREGGGYDNLFAERTLTGYVLRTKGDSRNPD